jgi:hypothetical protein
MSSRAGDSDRYGKAAKAFDAYEAVKWAMAGDEERVVSWSSMETDFTHVCCITRRIIQSVVFAARRLGGVGRYFPEYPNADHLH